MALIRGLGSLCPCPKCEIPWNLLSDLSLDHKLRSASETKHILEEASTLPANEKEDLLKEHGLRDIAASVSILALFCIN